MLEKTVSGGINAVYEKIKNRTVILFWVFTVIFCSLAGHLAYIQFYEGGRLSSQALSQQTQLISLERPPRGRILDRDMEPLTYSRTVSRIIVIPWAVTDKDKEIKVLAEILDMEAAELTKYFSLRAEMISRDLTKVEAEKLKHLKLPGIVVSTIVIRNRKPSLATHMLGFLGIGEQMGSWVGKMGIESAYDTDLRGSVPRSALRVYLDAKGRMIGGLGYQVEDTQTDRERKNVVLTIDKQIQEVVEKVLDQAGVTEGAVVVMEAGTGDIVAVSSRPDYFLGETAHSTDDGKDDSINTGGLSPAAVTGQVYNSGQAQGSYLNRALLGYQPGSVFKVVVTAAVLEEEIIDPEETFLCVGDRDEIIKCYLNEGHGLLTFSEAVAYSCNPVFARAGLKLGTAKLIEYAKRFGLDSADITGYQTVDTEKKIARIAQKYNLVNASLGQWPVEASTVQITAMMNTIAGNGIYVQPRLVQMIVRDDGSIERIIAMEKGHRAVSEKTAQKVREMLEGVTRNGTGKQAWVDKWGSAGKTGSAQAGAEQIDAWFSGYAPLVKPKYVATVLVTGGESGGRTAAPIFREIMEAILEQEK